MTETRKNILLLVFAACTGAILTVIGGMLHKRYPDSPLSSLFTSSESSTLASACVQGQEDEEIYFVSCGGTF